eukprot:TRINITY_DN501_c0_g1_i2.p1 TRINITY_DN501_c0_g1~~TRINITY_DN501_c0_g1_i2.p1  ORF type:complete len:104 (-),score=19.07 TRINITY_DN501_c0_g1_i2:124-435(-)
MARRLRFIPTLDRVLVRRLLAAEKTAGGIVLPSSSKTKIQECKVVDVGPGYTDANGVFRKPTVKPDERVYISEYGGHEIELNDEDFVVIREEDILGIVEETGN